MADKKETVVTEEKPSKWEKFKTGFKAGAKKVGNFIYDNAEVILASEIGLSVGTLIMSVVASKTIEDAKKQSFRAGWSYRDEQQRCYDRGFEDGKNDAAES